MSQKGFVHILLLILLLAGIALGVYLVGQKTNLLPKASVSKPTGPETSFTLVGPNDCASGWICALQFRQDPQPGEEFEVKLYVRSDIDEANLFQAKMKFPVNLVEVTGIKTDNGFIKNWVENFYDNSTGEINLTGGMPAPGFQTKLGGESALMATIVFKAKTGGTGTVFFDGDSAIYRNTDNENILKIKREYDISIDTKPSPTPTPPADSSRVFVTSTTYDGNLGGLSGADAKCQTQADAASLGGTWKAWLSDGTASVSSRLIHSTNPYKLLDGKVIANNWIDLTDGTLQNPIHVNEFNQPSTGETRTWTGTKLDGSKSNYSCENWSNASSHVVELATGYNDTTDSNWTLASLNTSCFALQRLYCFEQTSISPTPSPKPTPTPPPGNKGDGNTDGKINLIDMSVLLSDFNKEKGFREPIDMNGDGKINTFDFSMHRCLLTDLGVIKGTKCPNKTSQ